MSARRGESIWTDAGPGRDRGWHSTRTGERIRREDEVRSRWLTRTITVKNKRPAPPVVEVVEVADG